MSLLALDLVIPCHVSKCGCVPKIDAQEIFQHFTLRGRNMSDQFQDITDTPLDSITWHGQTGLMWLVPCYSQESRKSMPEYQLTDVVPVLFAAPWPVSNFHRILYQSIICTSDVIWWLFVFQYYVHRISCKNLNAKEPLRRKQLFTVADLSWLVAFSRGVTERSGSVLDEMTADISAFVVAMFEVWSLLGLSFLVPFSSLGDMRHHTAWHRE